MQTKLTLRLEDSLIQQAKGYAKEHDQSVSQLVANYFQVLMQQPEKPSLSPVTQSLIGILESSDIEQKDYKDYLEEKFL